MIINCPNCAQPHNVIDSFRGEVIQCQRCSHPITLPEIKDGKQQKKLVIKGGAHSVVGQTGLSASETIERKEENNGCLCYLLGFLFGPIGILIAAVIAKANGAITALRGMFMSTLLLVLIYVLVHAYA